MSNGGVYHPNFLIDGPQKHLLMLDENHVAQIYLKGQTFKNKNSTFESF